MEQPNERSGSEANAICDLLEMFEACYFAYVVGSFHNFIAKILVDIVWSRVSGDTNLLDTSRDDPIDDCRVEHSNILC